MFGELARSCGMNVCRETMVCISAKFSGDDDLNNPVERAEKRVGVPVKNF
jgi:hypothetical protein